MPDRLTSARLAGRVVPALGAALRAVPPPLLRSAVDGVSLVAWALAPGRRRATAANYAALFRASPRASMVRRLVRQAFKQYGRMSLEFFTLTQTPDADLLASTQISGQSYLDEALARGHGAILVSPHLGNWDLAARICLALGYPLTAVVEDDWSAEFAGQVRQQNGLRVVARARSLRPIRRALARNEPVALLCDVVPPGSHAVEVCFAGQRAYLPAGPARLALASGAPLLPFAVLTLADGRRQASAEPLIFPPASNGPAHPQQEQVRQMTQELACRFERLIKEHPEQWYAFRPLGGPANAR
jgi:lauroyl/myristoyl acyltransferase